MIIKPRSNTPFFLTRKQHQKFPACPLISPTGEFMVDGI